MIRKFAFSALIMALCWVVPASAQTVDELIKKNLDAHGGLDNLRKVQSVKITGRIRMQQGIEAPFVMLKKRPDMLRLEFTVGAVQGIQAFDGSTAWAIMPFMGVKGAQKLPKDQTEELMIEADFDGPLVDYKQKGHTVELVGKEQVEGAEAHKIKLTRKDGNVRYYYFDPESGLEVKATTVMKREGADTSLDTYFSNFQKVDDLIFPFSLQQKINNAPGPQFTIEQMQLNIDLDNAMFKMPQAAPAE